jgi:hypothetical protein
MPEAPDFDQLSCPVPMMSYEHVLLTTAAFANQRSPI